jgi:hypothetical protein
MRDGKTSHVHSGRNGADSIRFPGKKAACSFMQREIHIGVNWSPLMGSQAQGPIRTQLQKILASAAFARAERMRRLLEFIVEHSLSSPNEPLKEMTLGMELYTSNGEFDPRITSVGRVDGTRLRTKLLEYYATEGVADPIIFASREKRCVSPCGWRIPRMVSRYGLVVTSATLKTCSRYRMRSLSQLPTYSASTRQTCGRFAG